MDDDEELKICESCGELLPLTAFKRHKNSIDGVSSTCKQCQKIAMRERRQKKKDEEGWKPRSWLGEYLGYRKVANCIIVTKKNNEVS